MSDAELVLAMATFALSTATENSLLLWRKGLLTRQEASRQASSFRAMAGTFEVSGNDDAATLLWTAANLLEQDPPPDQSSTD